jgi:hypothetical protein
MSTLHGDPQPVFDLVAERIALVNFVADQLDGYADDAGMAVPQENHFLFAVR